MVYTAVIDCRAVFLYVVLMYVLQNSEGLNDCEQILSANGMVTALCIDTSTGAIVAGVQNVIR